MKIRDVDINTACGGSSTKDVAKQWSVKWGTVQYKSGASWETGFISPTFSEAQWGLKSLTVVVRIKGDTREEMNNAVSNLIALCRGSNSRELEKPDFKVTLDGWTHTFQGMLNKYKVDERSVEGNKWTLVTLELHGYECGKDSVVSATLSDNKTATVHGNYAGNALSPANIRMTFPRDYDQVTIKGVCHQISNGDPEIIISNVPSGATVIIEGNGNISVTDEGETIKGIVKCKAFPALMTAELIVVQSGKSLSGVDFRISATERFM